MERCCVSCGVKSTCLKHSMGIFLLYIQTGRINELTEDVRENINCTSDCDHWKRMKNGGASNGNTIS